MKKLFLIVTLIFVLFAFLSADVYIKTKTHTDAFEMMGNKQPAKDEISEQWIGKNTFAQTGKGQSIVIDLNENKMYIILHASKSYVESNLPLDLSKLLPAEAAPMLKMMKLDAKVTPTGETKLVGKWNCKGYDVVMNMSMMMKMQMKLKVWATKDVPFDWEAFSEKMLPAVMKASQAGMPLDDATLDEFKKIDGYQIASEMSMDMMGATMRANTQVLEISNKPAPAGIYAPPSGYTLKDKLSMKEIRK